MKTPSLKLLAATLVVASSVAVLQAQPAGEVIPDKYIVQLKPGVDPATVALGHGAALVHVYKNVINGYAGFIPPGLLARVAADPRVETIVPDRVVEAYGKPGGGGVVTAKQVTPAGVERIGAPIAHKAGFTGSGVGVAIVDTGIDFQHADLSVSSVSFTAYGTSAQDDNGHGTHVAGIVAAKSNLVGVVGVAPNATLFAVKVLDARGSGYDSDIIRGLDWVANHNKLNLGAIKVVNMSLGRPGTLTPDDLLQAAIKKLTDGGVTVVVAAGNDCGMEVSQQVPATYPEVIAVGATTAKSGNSAYGTLPVPRDMACYFTTDGAFEPSTGIGVTISAPGEDQENVLKGYRFSPVGIESTALGGGTTRMSGTSMAAPHVTGVVALMHQKAGTSPLLPEKVRTRIRDGADAIGTAPANGVTTCYTYDNEREGILYAPNALALVP